MTDEPTRTVGQALLSAWQDELQATRNPIVKEQCLPQEPDLLPRFAAHYQQLRALRRRVRAGTKFVDGAQVKRHDMKQQKQAV
jgi:hypothetical protein